MSNKNSRFFVRFVVVLYWIVATPLHAAPPDGDDHDGQNEEKAENPFDPDVGHVFYELSELSAKELRVLKASRAQVRRLERVAKTAFVCKECSGNTKKKMRDVGRVCARCSGSKINVGQEFKDAALRCIQAYMRLETKYNFEDRATNAGLKTWLLRKIKTVEAVRQINRDSIKNISESRLEPGQLVLASAKVYRIERLKVPAHTQGEGDDAFTFPSRTTFYLHVRLSPSDGKQHNLILPLYKLPTWLQDNSHVLLCGQFFHDSAYREYGGTTEGSTHVGLALIKRLPRHLKDSLEKDVDTPIGGC